MGHFREGRLFLLEKSATDFGCFFCPLSRWLPYSLMVKKSNLTSLRLIIYHMIYRVLAPSNRWLFGISEPSTTLRLDFGIWFLLGRWFFVTTSTSVGVSARTIGAVACCFSLCSGILGFYRFCMVPSRSLIVRPWKVTFPIGKWSSNHHFSEAMLNFQGVDFFLGRRLTGLQLRYWWYSPQN